MAGPSAMGSVNGMPISITSAPAPGSAPMMSSEVFSSGSPAMRKVTSAARPSSFKEAKRRSIRVVIGVATSSCRSSIGRTCPASLLPHRGEADVDGADHHASERSEQLEPFLLLDNGSRHEQPRAQEIHDVRRGDDDQHPADDLLPADQSLFPRCSATVKMSLSPRPHMFITIRWSWGFFGASSRTLASACAGSSAGMMPSSWEHN